MAPGRGHRQRHRRDCAVNVAGPDSRKVLEKVCADLDLSAEAFPYLGVRQGTVAGIKARLLRVGFVGELGYEIHVPARHALKLWDALMRPAKHSTSARSASRPSACCAWKKAM
jgi:glycine cleavage system aminomethyltransferase T